MRIIKEFKGSLNSIFNDEDINNLKTHQEDSAKIEIDLPINRIKPSKDQPRKIFNEATLFELTQSIKEKGVIQPIIVRTIEGGFYEIIVGERRFRAAKRAGLDKIPAVIRDFNKSDRMACALIENIQRENLNPLEEAEAIQSLIEECSMTHNQVAFSIGRSRTTISNLLRLLDLEEEVKELLQKGLLEMGHARALLSLKTTQQIEVSKMVVKKSLSVRATEKLIQSIHKRKEHPTIIIDPDFAKKAHRFKVDLAKQLTSKVNVLFNRAGTGRVVIHFDSLEKAYWLMEHLKIGK